MKIQRVAVVGSGLMGTNIALDFALHGYPVTLTDRFPDQLARSQETLRLNLQPLASRGLLNEPGEAILGRIEPCRSLVDTLCDADLVVEAASEDLELKQELFGRLDFYSPQHALLASNTSSFMPTSLAQMTGRPEQVLVAHYFNPAHLMPLVELVPGRETAEETVETLRELYRSIGKHPVVVRKETLGFIGNRLQFAMLREALSLVENGVATPEDVDTVIKSGLSRRLPVTGLFGTFDLAGLDTILAICRVLFPDLSAAPEPGPALTQRVEEGRLGVKSGAGFYEYTPAEAGAIRNRLMDALIERQYSERE